MNRILILGSCGSGKSTFAKKLHTILGLKLIHLDQAYWKPNWTEPTKEEWTQTLQQLLVQENWIIDGNYNGSLDMRIERANTIIYLNHPTWLCLFRVLKRVYKYFGTVRPDMPEGCKERLDWAFLHYVLVFKKVKGTKTLAKLKQISVDKTVLIFKNDSETEAYLLNLIH